jgi:hypothetical protein
MKIFDIKDTHGGWFVGNFFPSALRTELFEAGVKSFLKDEVHQNHYHKIATEINYISKGTVKINDEILTIGKIFIINPSDPSDISFLEDTEIFVIKFPSVISDKYII